MPPSHRATYYNENDQFAAAWLRELIKAGLIPEGEVDERSIVDVRGDDLVGFDQCHFFAGIGGWSLALALACWPEDLAVWTGSCPCQPLSVAGQQRGHADERHLWPAFHRLIAERRPAIVLGEQVAGKDGLEWFAGVRADLEADGYACGAAVMPACAVGAPHRRERLWWGAVAQSGGGEHAQQRAGDRPAGQYERLGDRAGSGIGERDCAARSGLHAAGNASKERLGAVADADAGRRQVQRQPQSGRIEGASGRFPDRCGDVRQLDDAEGRLADAKGQRERPDPFGQDRRDRKLVAGAGARGDSRDDGASSERLADAGGDREPSRRAGGQREEGGEAHPGGPPTFNARDSDSERVADAEGQRPGRRADDPDGRRGQRSSADRGAGGIRPGDQIMSYCDYWGVCKDPNVCDHGRGCVAPDRRTRDEWDDLADGVGDACPPGLSLSERGELRGSGRGQEGRATLQPSGAGFWSDAQWLTGADGKTRRIKPGVRLLVDGVPNRVGALRGFGNAIVPALAAEFIRAFGETLDKKDNHP